MPNRSGRYPNTVVRVASENRNFGDFLKNESVGGDDDIEGNTKTRPGTSSSEKNARWPAFADRIEMGQPRHVGSTNATRSATLHGA
jgi:hypothetical protein